jgi:hypothetical protein
LLLLYCQLIDCLHATNFCKVFSNKNIVLYCTVQYMNTLFNSLLFLSCKIITFYAIEWTLLYILFCRIMFFAFWLSFPEILAKFTTKRIRNNVLENWSLFSLSGFFLNTGTNTVYLSSTLFFELYISSGFWKIDENFITK